MQYNRSATTETRSSSSLLTTLPLLLNPIQDSPGKIVRPLNDSLN